MSYNNLDTSNLSSLKIAALVTNLLPNKQFTGFQELEDGDRDYKTGVIITAENEQFLIRTPRQKESAPKFTADIHLSKIISEHFNKAPHILAKGDGIAVYQIFRGKALTPSSWTVAQTKNVARALAKLHSSDSSIAESNSLPFFTNEQQRKKLLGLLDEAVMLNIVPTPLLERFENILNDENIWTYDSAIINGSITPGSILFQDDEITTILDWSNMHRSDPAYDIAGFSPRLNSQNTKIFYDTYTKARAKYKASRVDHNLKVRADFYSEFEIIEKLLLANAAKDKDKVSEIVQMLEALDERIRLAAALQEVEMDEEKRAEIIARRESMLTEQDRVSTQQLDRDALIEAADPADIVATTSVDILNSSPTLAKLASDPDKSDIEKELEQMLDNNK